jgi:VanZ family protein
VLVYFLPGDKIPGGGFLGQYHLDKIIHFTLFFVWMLLFYWSGSIRPWTKKTDDFALLLFLIPAVSFEFLQPYWAANRSFDPADLLTNITGLVIAHYHRKKIIAAISKRIQ